MEVPDDPPPHHAHKSLGSHERIGIVGKGSFGIAYLCRRANDGRLVVIKEILLDQMTEKERILARNEIKVLSSIHHPHIVSYYDSFEVGGILMIEMEYADGGSLDQYLLQLARPMKESDILPVLEQLASALDYMHHGRERPILHRDLKPANIFLMAGKLSIKVGDFGISKMLTTRRAGMEGRHPVTTFVGTPYYTSPEIYERKFYDSKSDIWSVGCILYEMATLRKPFLADNLMGLYKAVLQGSYPPIRGEYSALFKLLIRDTLQRDPEFRPSAKQILEKRLPDLMAPFRLHHTPALPGGVTNLMEPVNNPPRPGTSSAGVAPSGVNDPANRSVLYRAKWSTDGRMQLEALQSSPLHSNYRKVSVSPTHFLTLATDGTVTSELLPDPSGIDPAPEIATDSNVQLIGKDMIDLAAGKGFSVFLNSDGVVLTCGQGRDGCLGHGDFSDVSSPRIVEKLILAADVESVACGPTHVVAVARQGTAVFAWGTGPGLGLSSLTQTSCPEEMNGIPPGCIVTSARCGQDATILLTDGILLLASGDNRSNRLGLDDEPSNLIRRAIRGLRKPGKSSSVVDTMRPVRLPSGGGRVMDAAIGLDRSVLLSETGHILVLGGHQATSSTWIHLEQQPVIGVGCAGNFSAAVTADSVFYCWGSGEYGVNDGTVTLEWPNPSQFLALYASDDEVRRGRNIRPGLLLCSPPCTSWLVVDTTACCPVASKQEEEEEEVDLIAAFEPFAPSYPAPV